MSGQRRARRRRPSSTFGVQHQPRNDTHQIHNRNACMYKYNSYNYLFCFFNTLILDLSEITTAVVVLAAMMARPEWQDLLRRVQTTDPRAH